MTTEPTPTEAITNGLGRLLLAALTAVFLLVKWAFQFPMLSAPVIGAVAAGLLWGWPPALLIVSTAVSVLLAWWRWHRASFDRWITRRILLRITIWRLYRRHWARLMSACKLHTTDDNGHTRTPALVSVTLDDDIDRVIVRMLPGQCPDDYHCRRARLAVAFEALDCRTRLVGPSTVELVLRHHETIIESVAAPSTKVEWLWHRKEAA
ncbi:hypothetical protein ACWEKT_13610 [Nocardia takedensis]